ncbi:TetR/AcrR family transcriptional regulator [Desulfuromonas sp. KJ2020]|nr:TetR/AcrR family transcriptional regulator [Desulfuromonas sp. KJ2020]
MSVIASQAQIAMGTIYRCFQNKESLIHAVYQTLEQRFHLAVTKNLPADLPLQERFLHIGRFFMDYCQRAPMDFRFLEQFQNSPFGATYRRDRILGPSGSGFLHGILIEALTEKTLKPLPIEILCALFFGPLICLLRDQDLGFIVLNDSLIDKTVAACWDAIRK